MRSCNLVTYEEQWKFKYIYIRKEQSQITCTGKFNYTYIREEQSQVMYKVKFNYKYIRKRKQSKHVKYKLIKRIKAMQTRTCCCSSMERQFSKQLKVALEQAFSISMSCKYKHVLTIVKDVQIIDIYIHGWATARFKGQQPHFLVLVQCDSIRKHEIYT